MQLTQFARACGRVPVGGHPDKRPDSRQGWETDGGGWISPRVTLPAPAKARAAPEQRLAAGGETGEPRIPRGT